MPSDEPWNLGSLNPDLRDTALDAARRKGVSVDEWLRSVIRTSAAADDRAGTATQSESGRHTIRRNEQRHDSEAEMDAIAQRLDALSRQLDSLSHRGTQTARAAAAVGTAPAVSPSVPARSKDAQGRNVQTDARITAQESEEAGSFASIASPPLGDWTSLEAAIAEIAERQRALDADEAGALRAQFTALSHRLESVAPLAAEAVPESPAGGPAAAVPPAVSSSTIAAPPSAAATLQNELRTLSDELRDMRESGGIEDGIRGLRQELAEVSRALADAAPRRAVEALEAEVHTLVGRLDENRRAGIDVSVLAGIEAGLAEIRETLRQFAPAESLGTFREVAEALDRRIEAVGAEEQDITTTAAALQDLARSVADLREIASRAASADGLIALAEEVQAIGDRVERFVNAPQVGGSDLTAVLERRFEELAAHLDARATAVAGVPEQLGIMVEQIATKLERVELGTDNSALLDAIAQQVTRLTQYVEATDARFDAIDGFERTMRDLLDSMDQLRTSTISAAELAAKEAALQYAGHANPAELESLRLNIDTLRTSQIQSDQRTQDTLEAVHDTLERLVDRLTLVETDLRDERDVHETLPPSIRPIEAAHAPSLAPTSTGQVESTGSTDRWARSSIDENTPAPVVQERRPIDPTLPADHPLEPGTAVRGRPVASAADRIAASEAALGPIKPAPEADAKSNFIAAARRAAQAAANMAPQQHAGDAEKPAGSGFAALAKRITGRRTLMLGVILLVGASMLHVTLNGIGLGSRNSEKPRTQVIAAAPTKPIEGKPVTAGVAAPAKTATVEPAAAVPTASQIVRQDAPAQAQTSATATASKNDDRTVATVSPLTIASIQLPVGDITGAVGRSTGLTRPGAAAKAPAAPATGNPDELPGAFSAGLRAAAQSGNPAAEYEVALRFAEGRGAPANLEQAARWFERAANRGLALAQYRLGGAYEKGQGVRKDLDQARRLYRAASEQGNAKSMHNLAVLYAEGIEGKPEFTAAAEWFRKAAARGMRDSQYNLGILYARGLGVPQNLAESFKWFALAAQQGDQDAGKKRDDVAARLDQQALVAARLAVQTFAVEPEPEEAISAKAPPGGWDEASSPKPASKAKPKATTPRREVRS